jgi:hypothetical protein
MKHLNSKKALRIFFLALTFFSLTGLGSCSMSTSEICASRLPEFDKRLDAAVSALSPWVTPGRQLASDQTRLEPIDREIWLRWAEDRLVEAQHYLDAVEGLPTQEQVREELSGIATDLVSFHGYARQGKGSYMVRTLERIQQHSFRARDLACPAAQTAAKSPERAG